MIVILQMAAKAKSCGYIVGESAKDFQRRSPEGAAELAAWTTKHAAELVKSMALAMVLK